MFQQTKPKVGSGLQTALRLVDQKAPKFELKKMLIGGRKKGG
jgi:hypothetical protein